MAEGNGRIVELALSVPDADGGEVASLVNLANMTYVRPLTDGDATLITDGDATLTRIVFLDGLHVDITEPLADVARLAGIAARRPQRRYWGGLGSRLDASRALKGGAPPESRTECRTNGVHPAAPVN